MRQSCITRGTFESVQHKLLLLFIGKKVIVDKEEICCSIYGIHGETSLQNDYIKYSTLIFNVQVLMLKKREKTGNSFELPVFV